MSFCLPHRVSLVLAVEGIPVHWNSIKVPRESGSCPFCRASREGEAALKKAVEKWVKLAKIDPKILSDRPQVSSKDTDKTTMDPKTQQYNKEKIREENNRKIVRDLTNGKANNTDKRSSGKPTKKPNHLRLV